MDLTESIVPNSAQLNAEDLLAGPRTVTINEVRKGPSSEQPVAVVLGEFGNDRPYLPCKSMRRVMVAGWGADASEYAGRRMTIYNDPSVKWGGMAVGGIRIRAMSHIDKPMTLALTVTRGKRAPYVVQPLADSTPPPAAAKPTGDGITADQSKALHASLRDANLSDRDAGLAYIGDILGREITSTKELSKADASFVIDTLKREAEAPTLPEPPLDEGGAA